MKLIFTHFPYPEMEKYDKHGVEIADHEDMVRKPQIKGRVDMDERGAEEADGRFVKDGLTHRKRLW